jgi:hypothetical protein
MNPIVEYKKISAWMERLVKTPFTPKNFSRRLQYFLRKSYPVIVRTHHSDELSYNEISVGGLYDPEYDLVGQNPVIINLIFGCEENQPYEIEKELVENLSLDILEVIIHEFRHMHQFRSRDFEYGTKYKSSHSDETVAREQEYLGGADEIDAYAVNLASRYRILNNLYGYDLEQSIKESNDIKSYRKAFGDGDTVLKRLFKKIVKNINEF